MPYDPRPESQGGNRGFGERFGSVPEKGNYRVIGVDTFDGTDWLQGDFETEEEARRVAQEKSGEMTKMHIYNKDGYHVRNFGTF